MRAILSLLAALAIALGLPITSEAQVQKATTGGREQAAVPAPFDLKLDQRRYMPRIHEMPRPGFSEDQLKERCLKFQGTSYEATLKAETQNREQHLVVRVQATFATDAQVSYFLADGRPTCRVTYTKNVTGWFAGDVPTRSITMHYDGNVLLRYNEPPGAGLLFVPTDDGKYLHFVSFYTLDESTKTEDMRKGSGRFERR